MAYTTKYRPSQSGWQPGHAGLWRTINRRLHDLFRETARAVLVHPIRLVDRSFLHRGIDVQ